MSRFIKLWQPPVSKLGKHLPPLTAVLHAQHGNCVGPLPAYECHTLGGPLSSRAYPIGDLGAARCWLETLGELRAPVPLLRGTYAYAFTEMAKDLGSTSDILGKPREFFQHPGRGVSQGAGVKLGPVRLEWVKDCNVKNSTWLVAFGERI